MNLLIQDIIEKITSTLLKQDKVKASLLVQQTHRQVFLATAMALVKDIHGLTLPCDVR